MSWKERSHHTPWMRLTPTDVTILILTFPTRLNKMMSYNRRYSINPLRMVNIWSTKKQNCALTSRWLLIAMQTKIKLSCRRRLSIRWRHNELNDVSNHRRFECLLNRLFRRRPQKTSKLRVTGSCEGNPPVTDGFPSQRASHAEDVSILVMSSWKVGIMTTVAFQWSYSKRIGEPEWPLSRSRLTVQKLDFVMSLVSVYVRDI